MDRDVLGLVNRLSLSRLHQVARHLSLAVDHHLAVAEIDAVRVAIEAKLDSRMHQLLGMHARADTGGIEQIHRPLLEHPGTDAAEDIVGAAPLEDYRVDAALLEKPPQHQPGGACADDG